MKKILFFLVLALATNSTHAQSNADSLYKALPANETQASAAPIYDSISKDSSSIQSSLLPSRYLFTQRLLWGEKGLMRVSGLCPLSPEGRDFEMDIRYKMNTVHQIAGAVALAGMIGSGITGQMIYTGNRNARGAHETLTGLTNIAYCGSLAFALFSPPPMKNRESGFTKLNIHKTLSVIHVASMLTTNILSGMLEHNPTLRPYHRAAAIIAFSSLFLATVVIKI